jgi:hypothetical protein
MWNESLAGVKKHLLTYSSPSNFTILAERPSGIDQYLSPKMDHLVCFMPGTIALATTGGRSLADARKDSKWGPQQEEDMRLAKELTKTCLGMYRTPTGLAPEIAHFNIYDPPLMYKDFTPESQPQSPASFDRCVDKACTEKEAVGEEDYVIKSGDVHNLQRPETVESLFYMWRITGDEMYRRAGWEMFQSFMEYGAVSDGEGYSSVANVEKIPVTLRDNMESFWLVSLTTRQDTFPKQHALTSTRPKPSSTSTSSSRPTTFYPSQTLSSTPKPTRSPNLRWASSSRLAGHGRIAKAVRQDSQQYSQRKKTLMKSPRSGRSRSRSLGRCTRNR